MSAVVRTARPLGALLLSLSLLLPAARAQTEGAAKLDDPAVATVLRAVALSQRQTLTGTVESSVYFPPRDPATRTLRALPNLVLLPNLVKRNFNVYARPDEVAGRAAHRFDFAPKVGDAARWALWLDDEWNLPLAYEERTANGDLARRAAFTSVEGGPRRRVAPIARAADGAFRRAVLTAVPGLRLPDGFVPVQYIVTKRGHEVLLSDGLNSLALVLADRNVKPGEGVAARRVAGGFVWLVGNLPQDRLAAALSRVSAVQIAPLGTFAPGPASNE